MQKKRIHFLEKFQYIYALISIEINKIISTSSNFLLLSAGSFNSYRKNKLIFFLYQKLLMNFTNSIKKEM